MYGLNYNKIEALTKKKGMENIEYIAVLDFLVSLIQYKRIGLLNL